MLVQIFWESKYYLMHAAAAISLLTSIFKKTSLSDEERIIYANKALISILLIPQTSRKSNFVLSGLT